MYNKPHACYELQRGRKKIVSEPKTAVWGSQTGGLRSWKERKPLAAEGWRQILASSSPPNTHLPPPKKITKVENSPWRAGVFLFFLLSSLPPGDHGTAAQSSRLIPVRSSAISESVCCDNFPSAKRIEGIPPMRRYLLSPLLFFFFFSCLSPPSSNTMCAHASG